MSQSADSPRRILRSSPVIHVHVELVGEIEVRDQRRLDACYLPIFDWLDTLTAQSEPTHPTTETPPPYEGAVNGR